jgi:hypothetical protein
MAYVLTYYLNTPDAEAAMPVGVGIGAEIRLADIRMLKAPTVRVSGRLSGNPQGKPIMVQLVPKGLASLERFAGKMTTVQQAGGSFELRGVAPGSYTLRGISPQEPIFGAQPLQVGQQNIDGLVLQVGFGYELPGVVVVEGKEKADLEKTQVQLQPLDFILTAPSGSVGKGGKFTLKDVAPDRYLVQVNDGPDGSYVKSVRFGGRDATAEGLDLTSGVTDSLLVTLSLEAAQVDGVVQDSDNKPVAGATVVLVPDSRRFSLYSEDRTGQNGAFSLKGITPGDYKLLAWEDIETGAYQDPEFLKKYGSKAESLSLKANDRRTIQVKVIPFEKLP